MALPSSVNLSRVIDGISVPDSQASATFVSGDVTIQESMYWPSIPVDVVRDALAFRTRLSDPDKLAEYKALLPADAQGDGEVTIHHSSQFDETFRAVAVYEVSLTPPADSDPLPFHQIRDFDSEAPWSKAGRATQNRRSEFPQKPCTPMSAWSGAHSEPLFSSTSSCA